MMRSRLVELGIVYAADEKAAEAAAIAEVKSGDEQRRRLIARERKSDVQHARLSSFSVGGFCKCPFTRRGFYLTALAREESRAQRRGRKDYRWRETSKIASVLPSP